MPTIKGGEKLSRKIHFSSNNAEKNKKQGDTQVEGNIYGNIMHAKNFGKLEESINI